VEKKLEKNLEKKSLKIWKKKLYIIIMHSTLNWTEGENKIYATLRVQLCDLVGPRMKKIFYPVIL